jgi:uncharacterized protein YjdB
MKMQIRFSAKFCLYLLVCAFIVSSLDGIANAEGFKLRDNLQSEKITKGKRFKLDLARIRKAISVQNKHRMRLMDTEGVFATATAISREGKPVVKIFTSRAERAGIPNFLDGVAVVVEQTERIYALTDPLTLPTERWERPVPIGVSTGHPAITAGTIGARVSSGASLYALSNNHVYADINDALIGDDVIQPGAADGGSLPDDLIGTLAAYEEIQFCEVFWIWLICSETNTIDAAIAAVSESDLGVSTPPDGYGTPNAVIHPAYGLPDVIDDADEDLAQLLGVSVQKYGRTTQLTSGTIDAINATVDVCYDQACTQVARFVDQLIITPGDFSAGGDSGSLIVTNDDDKNPVGLLYAGSSSHTIANRIDRVLTAFNVEIDSEPPPELRSIEVDSSAESNEIKVGQNLQFIAIGTFDDGSMADITDSVSWESSNTTVASINSAGLATGVSEGTTDITASMDEVISKAITLTVTAASVTLDSITIEPTTAEIAVGATQQFSATGIYSDDTTADLTSAATWFSDDAAATISAAGLATGEGEGTAAITAAFEGITSVPATLFVNAARTPGGPHLQVGKTWVSTANWTTVTLDHDYGDNMVVVCTPNYEHNIYGPVTMPLVAHVTNAAGSSFEVTLVQAVGGAFEENEAWVHWMVVAAGVYNDAEHGVKMEAAKFDSNITDRKTSWGGTKRAYAQAYTNPVVVGQVMSLNSYDATMGFDLWSVFWCRGSNKNNPPSASSLWVGKHAGEDPRARDAELLGYIVIEAGSGSIGTTGYIAALGSDSIRGMGDSPPYSYPIGGLSDPSNAIAIIGQAAMDGGNGGWAILHGDNPISNTFLNLAIDEDQAIDNERRHTTEQVGYIVFEELP